MTTYLTGVSTPVTREAHRNDLGLLVTPASAIHRQLHHYETWGADNGCYVESKAGRPFDPDRWMKWLAALPRRDAAFVALPDVLEWPEGPDGMPRGNLDATLERSARYVDFVRGLGMAPALVAQDGLRDLSQVPFQVDGIFVGGSDFYKLGPDAARVLGQARERGLWTHVGRVNSFGRLAYCDDLGADSADGTYIQACPSTNGPKVLGWLDKLQDALGTYKAAGLYRQRLIRQGIEPGYYDDNQEEAAA